MLETAERCPSVAVAADMTEALELDAHDRSALMAHALCAGRSRLLRVADWSAER